MPYLLYLHDIIFNFKKYHIIFYAFQSVFFATIYNYYVIRSSYFISGFGAGNKMIDLYVILAMPFISFLVVVIYIIEIPSLAMPLNMILAVYVIPCILSYDFNKLTILYIHVHISLSSL